MPNSPGSLFELAFICQFQEIRRGIDVLVGTPGRVLDHLSKTGPNVLNLSKLEYVVLDEVDRMLDMGFAEDVEKILSSGTMKFSMLHDIEIDERSSLPFFNNECIH